LTVTAWAVADRYWLIREAALVVVLNIVVFAVEDIEYVHGDFPLLLAVPDSAVH
jgi:hypothetical protein